MFCVTKNIHSPQFICYGLIFDHPDSRHFFEHPLAAEGVESVYFQFGVPDVLQKLRRLVHLLQIEEMDD